MDDNENLKKKLRLSDSKLEKMRPLMVKFQNQYENKIKVLTEALERNESTHKSNQFLVQKHKE